MTCLPDSCLAFELVLCISLSHRTFFSSEKCGLLDESQWQDCHAAEPTDSQHWRNFNRILPQECCPTAVGT